MLYPLTKPQYLIYEMESHIGGSIANIVGGMMCSWLTAHHLEKALKHILKTNDGLRIRLIQKDYIPYQYVEAYDEAMAQQVIDFKTFQDQTEMDAFFAEEARKPFEKDGYLCQFYIVTVQGRVGAIAKLHHLISDAWTIVLMANQVLQFDEALAEQPKAPSYLDYVQSEQQYIQSEKYQKDQAYWLSQFAMAPEAVYLSEESDANYTSKRMSFKVDEKLVASMKTYCDTSKSSIYSLWMSALGIYLSKTKVKDSCYIGTAILNRSGKKEKNTLGMFVNTAAVLMSFKETDTFDDMVKQTTLKSLEVFRHQKYQYGEVLKDLRTSYGFNDKLYDVMVSYQNAKLDKEQAVEHIWYPCGMQCESLEVHISDREDKGELTIDYDYQVSKFKEAHIYELHHQVLQLIQDGITKSAPLKALQMVSESQRQELLYTLNETACPYPDQETIVSLFEKQVEKTPQRIVLQEKDRQMTYQELDAQSEQFAQYLVSKGCGVGSIVGIFMPRSIELMVGILGVLKAGGAYLPIDASYPMERVTYMLEDSKATMLITTDTLKNEVPFKGTILTDVYQKVDEASRTQLVKPVPNDLIYIIYTSGSTGNPKGVMLTHQSVVHYITWAAKVYLQNEKCDFPLFTSISFDLTVTSLFTPLLTGNRLVIYGDDLGGEGILKVFEEDQVGIVKLTPTHLKLVMDKKMPEATIKRLIVGGEQLECFCAKKITDNFGGDIAICNEYGPTEATVGCMLYKYDESCDKGYAVPIGKPADNTSIYLLDKWLQPVPRFVKGEMYIAGEGLAKGYLGREDLTADRFVADPFKGGRMYKTGDIALRDEMNNIIFCGRVDHQVKIRGHRIEVGEIEDKMMKYLPIQQVVVKVLEESNEKYLCAYYVAKESLTVASFRKALKPHLPEYMIPMCYQKIDSIPMTINGKIDACKLPKVCFKKQCNDYVAPRTDLERSIAHVFEEVLGIQRMGMKDSFLGLGGDSIKAIQIVSRLNDLNIQLESKDILGEDVLEQIILAAKEEAGSQYDQGIIEGQVEATPILKWFENQHFSHPEYYCQTIALRLTQPVSATDLTRSFKHMIQHSDTLRLNKNKEGYYYNNALLEADFQVEEVGMVPISLTDRGSYFREKCLAMKKRITLDNAIPLKATLFNYEKEQILVITAHHMVMDGVTWRLLIGELKRHEHTVPSKKTASYKVWGTYLRSYGKKEGVKKQIKFWNEMQQVQACFDVQVEGLEDGEEKEGMIRESLGHQLTEELMLHANKAYSTTVEELLVCGLMKSLKTWQPSKVYTIELEGHGRGGSDIDVSSTAGWFTAIYPMKLALETDDLGEQIISIKEQLRQVQDGGIAYGVLKYLEEALEVSGQPEIRFNYLGTSDFEEYILADTGPDKDSANESGVKLDINCMVCDESLIYWIQYDKRYISEASISTFVQLFKSYMKEIVTFT
ncbi:MAG: amino acid adenylation domain-containing protein, partial [Cellulosilyticaceae bacterium]